MCLGVDATWFLGFTWPKLLREQYYFTGCHACMILTSLSSGWSSIIKFAVAVGVLWSYAMWWKVPIQCNVFVAYRRSIVQFQRLHVSNFNFQVHSWRLFACWPQHSCGKRVQKEHSRTHKQSAWFEHEDAGNPQLFSKSHFFSHFFTFFTFFHIFLLFFTFVQVWM